MSAARCAGYMPALTVMSDSVNNEPTMAMAEMMGLGTKSGSGAAFNSRQIPTPTMYADRRRGRGSLSRRPLGLEAVLGLDVGLVRTLGLGTLPLRPLVPLWQFLDVVAGTG